MQKESIKTPQEEGKKTSVLLTPDLVQKLSQSPLNQSQTILEALRFFFSEDKERIFEYQSRIISLEKNLAEAKSEIAILTAKLSEFEFIKNALTRSQDQYQMLMGQQEKHVIQVQKMLTQRDEEIRQREEKIFLLEEKKKKKWWKRG